MILLELTTESGAVYVANVINQKIRRIAPDGGKGEWMDYKELQGGEVGQQLLITYKDALPVQTTTVVKMNHAVVD